MANKPTPADFSPTVPDFPEIGQYQPIYGKFDLTTYVQGASDYEIMAFLVQCYNATLKGYSEVTQLSKDTVTAYNQLQTWVNIWFDNLDVQKEIDAKLQEMYENGSLANAIANSPAIIPGIAQYLNSPDGTQKLTNITTTKLNTMAQDGSLASVVAQSNTIPHAVKQYLDSADGTENLANVTSQKLEDMAQDGSLASVVGQSNTIPYAVKQYLDSVDGTENLANVTAQKLEDMAVKGQLGVQATTTQWLTNNVTPVGSAVVVDRSLSIAGAAADAKATGDALNSAGIRKVTVTSLKASYQVDDAFTPIKNDWVYTCGDWAQLSKRTKKVIMDIQSNGGTGTIYITDPQNITRYVHTYTFVKGVNHVEIDVSTIAPNYDFMKIQIYSDTEGAFTNQSSAVNLYVNGDVFTFYSQYNNKDLGSRFTVEPYPTYWDGNIKINKTYPCIDIYFQEEIEQRKTGLIIVAKDGTGDYTTINEAVRNAGDIGNPTTILLREGVYDEVVYLRNKHEISIVGINRDKCVIQNTTGIYAYTPVMVNGNFELRNLTMRMLSGDFVPNYGDNVFAGYPGYALHVDGESKNPDKKTVGRISNCTMYSEAFPAAGLGVNKNQTLIFENCEFVRNCTKDSYKRDNWQGSLVCHSSNVPLSPNQNFYMKDCVLRSNYGSSGQIRGDVGDSANFTITAINNTCYSDETGLGNFTYNKGQSTLSPMSHGNTASVLNS